MDISDLPNLIEDLATWVPEDAELCDPVKIAQITLFQKESLAQDTVISMIKEIDQILESWKKLYGEPRGMTLLDIPPKDCSGSKPWYCSDFSTNSAYDLYTDLLYDDYEPIKQFHTEYSEKQIYATLIIYDSVQFDYVNEIATHALLFRLSVHKATVLLLLSSESDLFKIIKREFEKKVYSMVPEIEKLVVKKAPSKMGAKGGDKKAEKWVPVIEFIVSTYNKGKEKYNEMSKLNASLQIQLKLQKDGVNLEDLFPNSDNPQMSIYRILKKHKESLS
jgi:hypothetical protein